MTERDDNLGVSEAFVAGDEQAFADIYARWSPLIYNVALRLLEDINAAENVTRQVFIGAWTSRRTFDSTRVSLPAWLIEITRNAVSEADAARRSRPASPASRLNVAADGLESESVDVAEQLLLADGMARLDAIPRQVLRMALRDELSHYQIAERIGLSPSSISSHLRRSLFALQGQMEVHTDAR